jgi:hypothetical protein
MNYTDLEARLRSASGNYAVVQRAGGRTPDGETLSWGRHEVDCWNAADAIAELADRVERLDGMLDRLAGISDDNLARAQRAESR